MKPGQEVLCQLQDIPDGGSRGFGTDDVTQPGILVVRRGRAVVGYRNSCPHTGVELNWMPDQFLNERGDLIQCSTHGALFRIEDGYCLSGPCAGARLEPVALGIEGSEIVLLRDRQCS